MGFFSFMTSDTNRSICNIYSERKTFPVYVLIPEEHGGGYIEEDNYEGYGIFGDHDIYDLVADWNRTNVSIGDLTVPDRINYEAGAAGDTWFKMALNRYDESCRRLQDFIDGNSDEYMKSMYGKNYKRAIGIDLACYDEENAALEYPIKIVEDCNISYDDAKPSVGDPDQGYFY